MDRRTHPIRVRRRVRTPRGPARRLKPRGAVLPPEGLLSGWRDQAVRRAASFLSHPAAPGHGPLLVAAGEIEASVQLAGGPWDHAPFVVLVEEAGGEFSDLWGGRRIDTATAIFSNGLVHRDVRAEATVAAPDVPSPTTLRDPAIGVTSIAPCPRQWRSRPGRVSRQAEHVRMYLSSFRLGNDPGVFVRLMGGRRRVLVIANGLDGDDPDTRAELVQDELRRLQEIGMEVEELDLWDYVGSTSSLRDRLQACAAVWLRGGNLFLVRTLLAVTGGDSVISSWSATMRLCSLDTAWRRRSPVRRYAVRTRRRSCRRYSSDGTRSDMGGAQPPSESDRPALRLTCPPRDRDPRSTRRRSRHHRRRRRPASRWRGARRGRRRHLHHLTRSRAPELQLRDRPSSAVGGQRA